MGRIEEIVQAAYSVYLDRMDRPPAPMLKDFAELVRAGDTWVLEEPAIAVISLSATHDALLVENVAVDPSRRGEGLGRMMMDFAEVEARRRGLRCVELYTNELMTENIGLYEHLGYVEVGRAVNAGYRRVFMEKRLDPSGIQPDSAENGP